MMMLLLKMTVLPCQQADHTTLQWTSIGFLNESIIRFAKTIRYSWTWTLNSACTHDEDIQLLLNDTSVLFMMQPNLRCLCWNKECFVCISYCNVWFALNDISNANDHQRLSHFNFTFNEDQTGFYYHIEKWRCFALGSTLCKIVFTFKAYFNVVVHCKWAAGIHHWKSK